MALVYAGFPSKYYKVVNNIEDLDVELDICINNVCKDILIQNKFQVDVHAERETKERVYVYTTSYNQIPRYDRLDSVIKIIYFDEGSSESEESDSDNTSTTASSSSSRSEDELDVETEGWEEM